MPLPSRRVLLLLVPAGVVALVAANAAARALLAGWREYRTYRVDRHPVPRPADAAALGLVDVALPVDGVGVVRGWYAPSRNGAAVVFAHGSGGDRRELLGVARALARAGYGALVYDAPGRGESDGPAGFGANERAALATAVAHAAARPDVRGGRVGAYGFSMGAYTLAQVAAGDARVRAVVYAAGPANALELTRTEYAAGGRAAVFGGLAGARLGGMPFDDPQPRDVVARIAPRPLLVVTGTADPLVPPAVAREVYAAAREPRRLWLVPGAGHGRYEDALPGFHDGVLAFFDAALAPSGPAGGARR